MPEYTHFHFIGIGGIGMSALARLLKSRGAIVSGTDAASSEITDGLLREGISVSIGHNGAHIDTATDCIIYTLAIAPDNSELLEAKRRNLPLYTYAEMLGRVSSGMKTIAVSGTHGKTTTTAMIHAALKGAGIHANMIVGSLLAEGQTNFVAGDTAKNLLGVNGVELFVAEACEYKKSFLNLSPFVLVITNIEADHLDFYRDLDDVKDAFMQMAAKVPHDGVIICDFNDPNAQDIIASHRDRCINSRDFIPLVPQLFVIGEHNVRNAAMALAVVSFLGQYMVKRGTATVGDVEGALVGAKNGLATFRGTWRRLEFRGQNKNGAIIYDDYGHHPTEIRATLTAIKQKYPDKKLVVFFQPHLYSRTKTFLHEFIEVLRAADQLFMMPIYAAREPFDASISSDMITAEIPGAVSLKNFDDARREIATLGSEYIGLTMGAGDVYLILK